MSSYQYTKYIFTLVSDNNGILLRHKFEEFLRDVLALPSAVYEEPSFGYNESCSRSIFDGRGKINVNGFLDTMMSDPGPQCLLWMPILHRMSGVENVFHPVQCEGCHRESFMGFRYKCQRCYNYQLCQDCFWRGRTSGNHSNDHEMKEYSSYKSPTKQIGHSIRKSFKCVPQKPANKIPHFPETPEKKIDLTNIVPATPILVHNGFHEGNPNYSHSMDLSSLDSVSQTKSPIKNQKSIVDGARIDDEHRLIARYAARLAADANNAVTNFQARSPSELNFTLDSSKAHRQLITQLESKNRDIMREIQRLRVEQEDNAKHGAELQRNPTLLAELKVLRQRKDELEGRMGSLQESRRELMFQLEGLMKLLKNHGSPRSTPGSSPRSRTGQSPSRASSTPSTPGDSLSGFGTDVRQAFQNNSSRSLRNDLLVAADSVTNAMSSLVKELNSEASSESGDDEMPIINRKSLDFEVECDNALERTSTNTDYTGWKEEIKRRFGEETKFMHELHSRKERVKSIDINDIGNDNYINITREEIEPYLKIKHRDEDSVDAESYVRTDDESCHHRTDDEDAELYDQDPRELIIHHHRYTTDDESCFETDQESYIRTDDEEGGNTDWEENMKRWVNR